MARKLRYNDEEGGMAKAQLQKIEMYAAKLNDMIHPDDELEGWVQAKLAVVAAYMGDVKHYLDYELKQSFGEGGMPKFKQRHWEVEFTWDGADDEGRKVNVMADTIGEAERKVKEKFGAYYKGLRIVEIEEDKVISWDEYSANVKKKMDSQKTEGARIDGGRPIAGRKFDEGGETDEFEYDQEGRNQLLYEKMKERPMMEYFDKVSEWEEHIKNNWENYREEFTDFDSTWHDYDKEIHQMAMRMVSDNQSIPTVEQQIKDLEKKYNPSASDLAKYEGLKEKRGRFKNGGKVLPEFYADQVVKEKGKFFVPFLDDDNKVAKRKEFDNLEEAQVYRLNYNNPEEKIGSIVKKGVFSDVEYEVVNVGGEKAYIGPNTHDRFYIPQELEGYFENYDELAFGNTREEVISSLEFILDHPSSEEYYDRYPYKGGGVAGRVRFKAAKIRPFKLFTKRNNEKKVEKMADGGKLPAENVYVEITKPTELKSKSVAKKVQEFADMGYRSGEILLKMAFVGTDKLSKELSDGFQVLKNKIFFVKRLHEHLKDKGVELLKKYYTGGRMSDLYVKYEGSTFSEDMREAKEYLGNKMWDSFTREEKIEATKYLKAQGLVGYSGEMEDLETIAAMQYAKGGSVSEKKVVDFIKSLEESKIIAKGAHANKQAVENIKNIVSMSKKEHQDYIKKNPNRNVSMIYSEYDDWQETYKG